MSTCKIGVPECKVVFDINIFEMFKAVKLPVCQMI
jgi:hypothetical protein